MFLESQVPTLPSCSMPAWEGTQEHGMFFQAINKFKSLAQGIRQQVWVVFSFSQQHMLSHHQLLPSNNGLCPGVTCCSRFNRCPQVSLPSLFQPSPAFSTTQQWGTLSSFFLYRITAGGYRPPPSSVPSFLLPVPSFQFSLSTPASTSMPSLAQVRSSRRQPFIFQSRFSFLHHQGIRDNNGHTGSGMPASFFSAHTVRFFLPSSRQMSRQVHCPLGSFLPHHHAHHIELSTHWFLPGHVFRFFQFLLLFLSSSPHTVRSACPCPSLPACQVHTQNTTWHEEVFLFQTHNNNNNTQEVLFFLPSFLLSCLLFFLQA